MAAEQDAQAIWHAVICIAVAPYWQWSGWAMACLATSVQDCNSTAALGALARERTLLCVQEEPALFQRLLHKSEGERSDWEYPFAVAGINLTFMLQEVVGLRDRRVGVLLAARLPASAPGRAFLELLAQTSHAFEQVGCPLLPVPGVSGCMQHN